MLHTRRLGNIISEYLIVISDHHVQQILTNSLPYFIPRCIISIIIVIVIDTEAQGTVEKNKSKGSNSSNSSGGSSGSKGSKGRVRVATKGVDMVVVLP